MIDNNFRKYIWNKGLNDIKEVLRILRSISLDTDSNILEAVADAAKTATEEFIDFARRFNMPKKMYKDVFVLRDTTCKRIYNVLNSYENENKKEKAYLKKISKQSIDSLIKIKEDLENRIGESIDIAFRISKVEDIILRKKYYFLYKKDIKKELELTEEELDYWISYYEKWIKESLETLESRKAKLDKINPPIYSTGPIDSYDENMALDEIVFSKKISKKDENQLRESISKTLFDRERKFLIDELASNFINNHIPNDVSDEDLNYWFDYCKKLLDGDIYTYNDKRKELCINSDGITEPDGNVELTNEYRLERDIFLTTFYLKNNNLESNDDLLKKLIKYELLCSQLENQIKISDEKIDYYYNYYNNLLKATKNELSKEHIKMFFKRKNKNKTMEDYKELEIYQLARHQYEDDKKIIESIKHRIESRRKFMISKRVDREYKAIK